MPARYKIWQTHTSPNGFQDSIKFFGRFKFYSTRLIQSGGTIDVRRRVPRWNENSLVGHHLVSQNREFSLVYDPILGREQLIKIIAKSDGSER